jgi:hypothetical protein
MSMAGIGFTQTPRFMGMTVTARGLVIMQTRNLLLSVSLILSALATASPGFARGFPGGVVHSLGGAHVSSGGGGRHESSGYRGGFFHGGRGYGYGYGGGGYGGGGYGYGGGGYSGVWGQGSTWGNGGGGYAGNYTAGGGAAPATYAASYAPEQLVKNYSWPDSHSTPTAAYAQAQVPTPTVQAPPTGKAAKTGVLDDLIKETSKY